MTLTFNSNISFGSEGDIHISGGFSCALDLKQVYIKIYCNSFLLITRQPGKYLMPLSFIQLSSRWRLFILNDSVLEKLIYLLVQMYQDRSRSSAV